MSKVRKCAYCGNEGKLTREHIWPNCIIRRMPELQMKYLKSRDLMTTSDLVIADVCEECNNKKLSPLDAYFCSLYDKYFKTYKEDKVSFRFEYDYDLLLRALLKITYNTTRTKKADQDEFEKYREVILKGNMVREDIAIKVDIVSPAIIAGQKVYPKSARCGILQLEEETTNFTLRMISVNSYYFYIILSKGPVIPKDVMDEFARVYNSVPGTLIHPYRSEISVDSFSGHDTETMHTDLIKNTRGLFEGFLSKKVR